MKRILLLFYLLTGISTVSTAQWNGSTTEAGTVYRSGNVSIGTETIIPDYATLYLANGGGLSPNLMFRNNDAAVDNRVWSVMAQGGSFRILTQADNGSSVQDAFRIARTGVNINHIIFPNGNVGIGTNSPTSKLDISGNMAVRQNATTAESIPSYGNTALFAWGSASHSSGTASGVRGAYLLSLNESTGTLTTATGSYSLAGNIGNGTGTVTTAYGVRAGVQSGNGTVGTGYGLYIENIRATTDYGLYQVDATDDNYFAGNVGIGTVTPYSHSRLHIKAPAANPWGIMAESSSNDRVIAMSHTGTHGVVAVSYLGGSGYTPLQFWTENQPRMTINTDGNVGIGTSSPNQKLTVKGTIYGEEIKVDLSVPGPDYVFEDDYKLPSLAETEDYIKENKHLPEVPSAKEMEENGIKLGEMNMLLLKKVEELTLYVIEQNKRLDAQQKEIEALKKRK